MKAVVIGRHNGQIPGVEVLEQVSPQYPADSDGTIQVLSEIFHQIYEKYFQSSYIEMTYEELKEKDLLSTVIFQACPAQLCVALHKLINSGNCRIDRIGFIISVPGERPAGARFTVQSPVDTIESPDAFLVRLIKHCNPNAKLEPAGDGMSYDIVTDRPMAFNFSHIEWLKE